MNEILVKSSLDGSDQPSLFDFPNGVENAPLLVGLHTWSYDRFNQVDKMLPLCRERGWELLLPEFRGPNTVTNPHAREACASRLARQDILDAVEHVATSSSIDRSRIMLLGGSGGGHMALMMAAYAPKLWRIVSAWVPITDLTVWLKETGTESNYGKATIACCGGVPETSPAISAEYRERSPMTHIQALCEAHISVHHGRHDSAVSYTHTFNLAQAMEKAGAKRFYFEIFNGGHELRYDVAFRCLEQAIKNVLAQPASKLTG